MKKGKVYLYGIFGLDISDSEFVKQLDQLEADGVKEVDIYMNTPGGDVPAGIAMFNALNRSPLNCTLYIDGMAASMGAAFLCSPKLTVKAYPYSKIMLHRINGFVSGNPDEIESELKMIRDFEENLIEMTSEKTGLSIDEVKTGFFDGKNHWLNAEEALELVLVSEVIENTDSLQPAAKLNDPREVYNHYRTQISNRNTNIDIDMKNKAKFTALLKLDNEASEEAIYAAAEKAVNAHTQAKSDLEAVKKERDQYKTQVDDMEKKRIENLVSNAIKAKKITEDEREHYTKLANADFELASKTLEKIPGHKSIMSQLGGEGEDNSIYAKRKDWTLRDWQKKDGKGLQNMKTDNPELYKSLYKAQTGKEPDLD